MAYNWNKMETITVPVGLNGWLYSGQIIINGVTTKFPVGVETSLPEPVAAMIRNMIAVEEGEKTAKPDNSYVGNVTVPEGKVLRLEKGAIVEDEAGALGSSGSSAAPVVVLEETTLAASGGTPPGIGAMFSLTTPYENLPENGSTCHVTLNGTEYTCTAMLLVGEVAGMALGNLSAIGVDTGDSDLPFGIALTLPDQVDEVGMYASILTVEALDTITISITQEASGGGSGASSGGGVFFVSGAFTGETGENGEMYVSSDKTCEEVKSAFDNGVMPVFKLATDGEEQGYVLPFTWYSPQGVAFSVYANGTAVRVHLNYEDDGSGYKCYVVMG